MRARTPAAAILSFAAACTWSCASDEKPADRSAAEPEGPGRTLLGISPDRWRCDVIASEADLAGTLGGPVRQVEPQFTMPRGVAAPCHYVVARGEPTAAAGAEPPAPPEESWSYDLDCRDNYLKTAEQLFAQYAQRSAETLAAYHEDASAAKKRPAADAGVAPARAPGAAREVAVGRKALDHGGVALLFLDDDAPCYVRVNGPDADRRLALATLIASRLREANAPMKPHADPVMGREAAQP